MKTRFAPSPTGLMHIGNLRTAIFNYLLATKENGQFILRIEDTDVARSSKEFCDHLIEDLQWLGLQWNDEIYKQSERMFIYEQYFKQLEDQNSVYPCFCTEEELSIARKVQLAKGEPPRYQGTCSKLTTEEIELKLASGLKPALRFRIPQNKTIEFTDLIKGKQTFKSNDFGDFIIRRQDNSISFMLSNAIDDSTMEITHALRGDDHLTNTPKQLLLLEALNLPAPEYGHFPMITGNDGSKLSKRNGSESIQSLREQGYMPIAILNYLARLGHYYKINELLTIKELSKEFNVSNINTSPAKLDNIHLKHWQKESILKLTNKELLNIIKTDIENIVPENLLIKFTDLLLQNILMPSEAKKLAIAFFDKNPLTLQDAEKEILQNAGKDFFITAHDFLQENQNANLEDLLNAIKNSTGAKGKNLFMPIRIALTGESHGPELVKILELMGNDLSKLRFKQAEQYVANL